jgi:error-prone DNA polymerase
MPPPLQIASGAERPRNDSIGDALPAAVPSMTPYELTEADYRMTALSLNGHPMRHLRPRLRKLGVLAAADLPRAGGGHVVVAGLVICRQRPGTAKGFVFLTLEDETGMANVVVRPDRFERQALLIARSPLLLVRGRLQVEGTIVNVRAEEFEALLAPVGAEHARRHDFR